MGKGRQQLLARLPVATLSLLVLALAASCALPKIVVLEDRLTAEQHNDLGYIYEQKGMNDLAGKEYALALKKRPDWKVPRFNLGNIAFKAGDYRKAEESFREVLELDPNDPDALNNLANALLLQGRSKEAREAVDRALGIKNRDEYLDTLRKIQDQEAAAGKPAL